MAWLAGATRSLTSRPASHPPLARLPKLYGPDAGARRPSARGIGYLPALWPLAGLLRVNGHRYLPRSFGLLCILDDIETMLNNIAEICGEIVTLAFVQSGMV